MVGNPRTAKFRDKDLVEPLRFQQSHGLALRGALKDAAEMQNLGENIAPGTADAEGWRMGVGPVDYEYLTEWSQSFKQVHSMMLGQFLRDNYQTHPEASMEDLPERFFRCVQSPEGVAYLEMHVPSTMVVCRVSPSHPEYARLEGMLQSETELGRNPEVLRQAVEQI
ncbi:TPA: hypothetical protein HA265_06785 [Candidatus Woesearchaeota archaeon]|nr:hypothetical protein [Candidatus Woesearchaeota archaeon]